MTRSQLIELLASPDLLDDDTLSPLKEVLDAYPFFQAGRLLWIKNLHRLDHIRFNSELKTAAAYVPDRAKLFFLINDLVSPLSLAADVPTSEVDPIKHQGPVPLDLPSESPSESKSVDTSGQESVREPEGKDFVFPSVDLLDYEKETFPSLHYSLETSSFSEKLSVDESHSFSEWLSVLRHGPVEPSTNEASPKDPQPRSKHKMDLIDTFLNNGDRRERIVPGKDKGTFSSEGSMKSVQENEDLMTETLANIFIRQKHYGKAANIFERLRLKYPEKSAYFARRLKELEEFINNQ